MLFKLPKGSDPQTKTYFSKAIDFGSLYLVKKMINNLDSRQTRRTAIYSYTKPMPKLSYTQSNFPKFNETG